MKEIRLLALTISNFKGCRKLTLELDGRSASVYGDNAAGKTTIYDALTWLLFGKDSRGSGEFEIKTLGPDGQVLDHGAVTEVEAIFSANGERLCLRKTYFEKWIARRGSAESCYDGNTSEYYVDGVPVKKYEYERRVGELVPEKLFRMLTGVTWFCDGMDWKERRRVLLEVCGAASDGEIMAQAPQFRSLAEAMGRLSLEDYKKKLQAERRGLSGARSAIPARLDECGKTVDELAGMDFRGLREQRSAVAARLEQLQAELLKLRNGTLLDSKRNELAGVKNELAAYINENNGHRQSQMAPAEDRRPALSEALRVKQREFLRWSQLAANEKALIEELEEKIQRCRELWAAEDAKVFTAANCPTCGQKLPEEAQEAARTRFEAEAARRKQEAVAAADREKASLSAAAERRERYISDAVRAENEAARLAAELESYVPEAAPEVFDLPGYEERLDAAQGRIRALEAELAALEGESAAIREEIGQKVSALRQELDGLDRELAKESVLVYARGRADKLRQEAREAGERLEMLDKQLFLCDEFTRYKVQFVEERINQRFRLVRFRLFQEQVNSGLADCCDATVEGVPYGSLNNGARINAGLDIIGALSEHYGVSVPLFIDNAESVTALLAVDAQVIRLVVSEGDKKLRCEYGT